MNKLTTLVANGIITPEDLIAGNELIRRAEFVSKAIEACKETLMFPVGMRSIECYSYADAEGEYKAWGNCNIDGVFTCYCNLRGNHKIGECNLINFAQVFIALEKNEFKKDLNRFLREQIDKKDKKDK